MMLSSESNLFIKIYRTVKVEISVEALSDLQMSYSRMRCKNLRLDFRKEQRKPRV